MRARAVIVAAWLLAGCRQTDAPPPKQAADDDAVSPARVSDEVASDGLPPLPADLAEALGSVYEAVAKRHAEPKPSLDKPLATNAEHQAWVDRELEPWRDSLREVGEQLNATRPSLEEHDVSDAELARHARITLVHSALSATLALDESITRVRVPLPDEARPNGEVSADGKRYMAMFLGNELKNADFWRGTCTQYAGGYEPVPADLEPWARHCQGMFDAFVESVCAAEKRIGFPPSAHCSGQPGRLPE